MGLHNKNVKLGHTKHLDLMLLTGPKVLFYILQQFSSIIRIQLCSVAIQNAVHTITWHTKTTLNSRLSSRYMVGIRHLIIPGPGQHIIDDEGHTIHVKPGDIVTIETSQLEVLEAIPWYIIKRVSEQLDYSWWVNVICLECQASHWSIKQRFNIPSFFISKMKSLSKLLMLLPFISVFL